MSLPEKSPGRNIQLADFFRNPNLLFYSLPEVSGIDFVHSHTEEELFVANALKRGLGTVNMKRELVVKRGIAVVIHTYLTFDQDKWEIKIIPDDVNKSGTIKEMKEQGWTGYNLGSRVLAYKAKTPRE